MHVPCADTPTTPDQAAKAPSADASAEDGAASGASYQAYQHSTSNQPAGAVSTAAGTDGCVLIRKRLQHSPKSSLCSAARSPSTHSSAQKPLSSPKACRTLSTAGACCPAGVAQVRVVALSDSDVSTPSESPCAGSPAGLLTPLRIEAAHDADADQLCSASTSGCSAEIPAAVSSPVGGLIMSAGHAPAPAWQGDAGFAGAQDSASGSGAPSSTQHSAAALVSIDAAAQHRASLTGSLPGGLNAVCALLPAPAQAASSATQLQAAGSGCSSSQQTLGDAAHCGLHAIDVDMQQQAASASSPGGVSQAGCTKASSGSNTSGTQQPAASHSKQRCVSFAPLPPSKDLWLQQLRQMPPEGKARFLRRLQLVGRKVWCMWRQRSRHLHVQHEQRHGLKRDWQQAAVESSSSGEDEQVGSPHKRALSQGGGLSRHTASRLSGGADVT